MKRKTVIMMCVLASTLTLAACAKPESDNAAISSQSLSAVSTPEEEPVVSGEPTPALDTEAQEEESSSESGASAESSADSQETPEETDGSASGTADSAITPGTTQLDALPIPLGTRMQGTIDAHTYAWFSFSTGQEAGATYNITLINASPDGNAIMVYLYDSDGEELYYGRATENGVPRTISTDQLSPNTTYYVCLTPAYGGVSMDYSLLVKNPNETSTAYKTAGTLSEAVGSTITEDGTVVVPGTNPTNAIQLPMDLNVTGTLRDYGNSWFAFTTENLENTTYKISFANTLAGSNDLMGYLYDEYGNELAYERARNDGQAVTLSTEGLKPDTTYYIALTPAYGRAQVDYILNIHPSAKEEKPDLVFETPFEINETQIKFVINEAIFIDEAQAKEALKPVAEAILAHPDHSILIAGTTATDGTQETCVDLSIRRANAVKDLLINTYGVPESQLQIVGLGYELDPFERGADRDANGNFVESEGKKNRRVVILDIDDPIAQELLKTAQ